MQCLSCIILSFAGSHHWDFSYFSSSNTLSKYTRRVCFTVQIVSDHIHEEDEEFEVVLEGRSLPDYATITSDVARVKILNVKSEFLLMLLFFFSQFYDLTAIFIASLLLR